MIPQRIDAMLHVSLDADIPDPSIAPCVGDRGQSARLLVDLAASLFGRTLLDKVAPLSTMQGLQNVA